MDASGVERIVKFSPERAFIGDIVSAVTGQPTPYTVDAIEASTFLTIELASFKSCVTSDQRGDQRLERAGSSARRSHLSTHELPWRQDLDA